MSASKTGPPCESGAHLIQRDQPGIPRDSVSTSPGVGLETNSATLGFFVGAGGQNSVPHTSMGSTCQLSHLSTLLFPLSFFHDLKYGTISNIHYSIPSQKEFLNLIPLSPLPFPVLF